MTCPGVLNSNQTPGFPLSYIETIVQYKKMVVSIHSKAACEPTAALANIHAPDLKLATILQA